MLSPARRGVFLGFSGEAFLLRSRFKGKVLDWSRVNQFCVRCVALRRWPPEPPLDKPKVMKNPFTWTPGRSDKISSKKCQYELSLPLRPQAATRPPKTAPRPPQDLQNRRKSDPRSSKTASSPPPSSTCGFRPARLDGIQDRKARWRNRAAPLDKMA